MTEPTGPGVAPTVHPWATEEDVPQGVRDLLDPADSTSVLAAALSTASAVLWALTGRRWAGAGHERTVSLVWASCPCAAGTAPGWLHNVAGAHGAGCTEAPTRLVLPDAPVTNVLSMTTGRPGAEITLSVEDVEIRSGYQLARLHPVSHREIPWPGWQYTVTYRFGVDPPAGGRAVAAAYAGQIALSRTGDGKASQLPRRVQTITRQGVTLAMLDPAEYLDKGRTGLPDVDSWIAAVNPAALTARPQVWSPDLTPTHRAYRRP